MFNAQIRREHVISRSPVLAVIGSDDLSWNRECPRVQKIFLNKHDPSRRGLGTVRMADY